MATTGRKEETKKLSVQGLSVSNTKERSVDDKSSNQSEDRFGSCVGSEDESDPVQISLIQQIVTMNLNLEKQIETLVLRREFGGKHHTEVQESIKASKDTEIASKGNTIKALKTELEKKEDSLSILEETNEENRKKLALIQTNINDMKQTLESSTSWLKEVQIQIVTLETENRQMQSGERYENTKCEISILKKELYTLQQNMKVMSKELHHARDVILSQKNSMKILETDKLYMQTKFKEDLQRLTMSVRLEIEHMRDIMQNQWTEMKYLRDQNRIVRKDVKEIKNMLSIARPDSSYLLNIQPAHGSTSFPPKSKAPPRSALPSLTHKRSIRKK